MEALTTAIEIKLKEQFGADIISAETLYDYPVYTVKKDRILEILSFLYHNEDLGFKFLTSLCGVHFPNTDKDHEFGVVYQLHNLVKNQRIRIKIFMPETNLHVPSITGLFSAANWLERETYDFYGILFKGHNNLIKILNMEDQPYFPLRKQYPLEDGTREDKDDKMFGR